MAPHFEFEDDPGKKLPGTLTGFAHETDDPNYAEVMHKGALLEAKRKGRTVIEVADHRETPCSNYPNRYTP